MLFPARHRTRSPLQSERHARRRSLYILAGAAATLLVVGGVLITQLPAQPSRDERELAPGLSLTTVLTQTADGPLRYWLVRADRQTWDLGLEIADRSDAIKKRSVRHLAKQSGALVAVNGGFFAYGGAAVGAVREKGVWQRPAWKNRTALGWNDGTNPRIGPLSSIVEVRAGDRNWNKVTLNGLSRAYSYNVDNEIAVITPQFARDVSLGADKAVVVVRNGRVSEVFAPEITAVPAPAPIPDASVTAPVTGNATVAASTASAPKRKIAVPSDGFLLVALDASQNSSLALPLQTPVSWRVVPQPSAWTNYENIVGAGPRLVEKGAPKTTEKEEEFRPDVVARGPRTAVGFAADGDWMLLVADGRQQASVGLTLPATAQLFAQEGAVEAMNLDGGSSTQLIIDGELINNPSGYDPVNPLRPREVMVTNALVLKVK